MSKLENELRDKIENDIDNLNYFIRKKVENKFIGNQNRKKLVKLLPVIIENTNNYNCDWINDNLTFIKTKGFLDTFIDNIDKFNFKDNNKLFDKLHAMFSLIELNDNQIRKVVDKLLETDCKFDYNKIQNLFSLIIRNHSSELSDYMLEKYLKNEKTCDACLSLCASDNKILKLVHENIDYILTNIKNVDLFKFKRNILNSSSPKENTKENDKIIEKIKNKIEENKRESVNTTIKNLYNHFISENIINSLDENEFKNFETILEVIYLIIEDIAKNEQVNISDMKILSSGHFSSAFEIGDKVIKIGARRGTKIFHNNPYVNAILLRKEFPISDNISFFVEVNEKVDTNSNISEEELYQLYKKVRDIHLIWIDVADRNVGRLLKDNVVQWREDLPLTDERLGLKTYRGNDILKKGDIVILDNDLIYDENDDPTIINRYSDDLQKEFEQRYQQEKQLELDNNSQVISTSLTNTDDFSNEYIEDIKDISTRKK